MVLVLPQKLFLMQETRLLTGLFTLEEVIEATHGLPTLKPKPKLPKPCHLVQLGLPSRGYYAKISPVRPNSVKLQRLSIIFLPRRVFFKKTSGEYINHTRTFSFF
jgi:hypothetical protein